MASDSEQRELIVDVWEVTAISPEGEETLLWLIVRGAKFRGGGVYTRQVLEQLAQRAEGFQPGESVMESEYFLSSDRLGFRAWRAEDLPLAMQLWTDARVTGSFGGPYTPEKVQERLEREMAMQREFGMQYWPVFLLAGGQHVGVCGRRPWQVEDRVPELGYHMRPEFWGQGLAVEAARAAIQFGFGRLGARAIFAGHHPENAASRKVLLKLGFRYIGDEVFPETGILEPTYRLEAGCAQV